MGPQIRGLAFFAVGYTIAYWAINILVDSYLPRTTAAMNPAPLAVLFGLGDPVGAPRHEPMYKATQNAAMAGVTGILPPDLRPGAGTGGFQ